MLAENIDALAAVKRDVNIPIVTGEELYTKFEFREVFEKQAADILNPDVCNVGGHTGTEGNRGDGGAVLRGGVAA